MTTTTPEKPRWNLQKGMLEIISFRFKNHVQMISASQLDLMNWCISVPCFKVNAELTLRVRASESLQINRWSVGFIGFNLWKMPPFLPLFEGYFKPKGPTVQGYMPVTPRSDRRVWLQLATVTMR